MNISKCSKCDRALIEEETKNHECKEEVLDYKIKGNTLWMFNGVSWFPMLMRSIPKKYARSDGFTHGELPDGDSTEPFQGFCIIQIA